MSKNLFGTSNEGGSAPQRFIINVDGGSRGNPGPAACGVVIRVGGTAVYSAGIFLGVATNNVAEYQGLLAGLAKAAELGAQDVHVISDSELLVRQMNGQYRVRNEGLMPLFRKARELADGFAKCSITHVRREHNTIADGLANRAMDAKRTVEE